MKTDITAERLLELGGSLNGIMQELSRAIDTPAPNPRKRKNLKQARMAKFENFLDSRKFKKRNQ
jgi:hypothetical protein